MKKALVNIINFTFILLLSVSITARSEIKVVTSIKPIHSLASYLMQGIGSPSLIVEGSNSPHNFTLKPSHAKMLQQADLVFWVGENLETPLEKPIKSISKKSKVQVFLVNNQNDLANFLKQCLKAENIVIGMGAGSISNWIKELPRLMKK